MVSNKDVVGRATRVVIKGDLFIDVLVLAENLYVCASHFCNFKLSQAIFANFP
jgi:hypothetical protein